MVLGIENRQRADGVFHALADATRRDIVMRSMQGEHSVSALARLYPMSFAAVQKHVAVLERAELVSCNIDAVRYAFGLLEALWRSRIDHFGEILADDPGEGVTT